MCDKCRDLDREIENYRRLHAMTDDSLARSLIAEAISDLEAEKVSLHPDQQAGSS